MRARVDRPRTDRRRPQPQQPPARTHHHHLRRRHRHDTDAPAARRIAAHAAPICATASAVGLPAGTRRSRSAPPPTRRSTRANPTRIGSACAAKRASQPRTVEAGRPASAVIRRHPHPIARASSADQITVTASTRLARQNRGNNTCVRPQPPAREQTARRGRIRRTRSTASRTNRGARIPPRRQPLRAIRTGKPARNQLAFDQDRINTYAKHRRASGHVSDGPSRSPCNAHGKGRRPSRSPGPHPRRPHPDATSHRCESTPAILTTNDAKHSTVLNQSDA